MVRARDDHRLKVFISHQWTDKQYADRLARELETFADVWMDFRSLRPGDRIQSTIDDVLEDVDLVLVAWTENASKSSGVQAEIQKCIELNLHIVPCFFTYDSEGKPLPPLRPPLNESLGVDFNHFGTGVAQIAGLILELQKKELPAEASMNDKPGARMLQYMQGYMNYLSNYRKLRGVDDQRAYWVDKIVAEIERFVKDGGSTASVRALLEAARRSEVQDPEGIGVLVERIERLLGNTPVPEEAPLSSRLAPSARVESLQWRKPSAPPADELARRVAAIAPAGEGSAWLSQVNAYIDSAPVALEALAYYARAQRSEAGCAVVAYLKQYLDTADDLIPDHQGRYGLLDDAWLILNTAFRLIESGLMPVTAVPVDWNAIIAVDHVVRDMIPGSALSALTGILQEMLQAIAAEVSSYSPWFTPEGNTYSPTIAAPSSAGGCWEDQMNEALRGTGLSV